MGWGGGWGVGSGSGQPLARTSRARALVVGVRQTERGRAPRSIDRSDNRAIERAGERGHAPPRAPLRRKPAPLPRSLPPSLPSSPRHTAPRRARRGVARRGGAGRGRAAAPSAPRLDPSEPRCPARAGARARAYPPTGPESDPRPARHVPQQRRPARGACASALPASRSRVQRSVRWVWFLSVSQLLPPGNGNGRGEFDLAQFVGVAEAAACTPRCERNKHGVASPLTWGAFS